MSIYGVNISDQKLTDASRITIADGSSSTAIKSTTWISGLKKELTNFRTYGRISHLSTSQKRLILVRKSATTSFFTQQKRLSLLTAKMFLRLSRSSFRFRSSQVSLTAMPKDGLLSLLQRIMFLIGMCGRSRTLVLKKEARCRVHTLKIARKLFGLIARLENI